MPEEAGAGPERAPVGPNNLRDEDTFNIIAYDDRVEAFKPELQRYS